MTDNEALTFLREYFHVLFVDRNIDALDMYLHPDHHDDDIGDGERDHIRNSKEYLQKLFERDPAINVDVKKAMADDNVITAVLEWYRMKKNGRETWLKGIGIFVMRERQILKRHTFFYETGIV